jgi:hypothetical protein
MFFKKKISTNQDTALDKKIKELNNERVAAATSLREKAKRVIICNGVIDLYLEGADKEAAKKEAEQAKYSLSCTISHYDDLCRQCREALDEQGERNTTLNFTKNFKTSQFWVELAYEDFFKKD